MPVGNRGPGRRATAQREEPHVSGLVDKDPVPPLVVGSVVLGVLAALGIFATGWLPWAMWPPSGEDVTGLLIASLVAALIGWASLAYGIVITAAKVDDIREMLRGRDGDDGRDPGPAEDSAPTQGRPQVAADSEHGPDRGTTGSPT